MRRSAAVRWPRTVWGSRRQNDRHSSTASSADTATDPVGDVVGADQLGAGPAGEAQQSRSPALERSDPDGEPHVEVGVGIDHEVEGADGDVVEAVAVPGGTEGREIIGHRQLQDAGHPEDIGMGTPGVKYLSGERP